MRKDGCQISLKQDKQEEPTLGCVIEPLQPAKAKMRWEKSPEQGDQQPRVELGSGEATALWAAAKSPEAGPCTGLRGRT